MRNRGSVKDIKKIPDELKKIYKTVWEIKQKELIDHSVARGVYVDQSQSMNLYFEDVSVDKLMKAHFYGWEKGLKTGSYYVRSQPSVKSAAFTCDSDHEHTDKSDNEEHKKKKKNVKKSEAKHETKSTELKPLTGSETKSAESAMESVTNEETKTEAKPEANEKVHKVSFGQDCEMCGS